ncbi:hypothetical protein A8V01_09045 [Novosphingobium guangzhouense]|uniref:Head-tail adaptor protein n=2 Tax=Novosphingobium guangzhouense TaxID=1850347 RepID=A0A2K2FUQ1_9SPHN|nr:hypothetical protein A8V01_09045 [Novosphingobium guangzhouense]
MRPAGQRDKLVKVQRYTSTQNSLNEDVVFWEPLGEEWGRVIWGRGSERRESAAMQSQQTATFQFLSNERTRSLSAKDRIVWNDINWDIVAPGVPVNRGELEFTAIGATH